ncbi:hypothetical protein FOL47_009111 [Perkinsus chesapeaki]|uniref:Uncharacterized protein n=1 Tax=Perkinsus chesapeaki TaxID=330153 RepID=A0A7J6LAA8_PERCH|nr:hypothetical protein FOL47_009111 [Perkinsus chesapeaki]
MDISFIPETGQFSQFINKIEFRRNSQVRFLSQIDAGSPTTIYTCVYVDKDVGDGIEINVQGVLCTRMIKDSNGLLDEQFLEMKATNDKTYLFTRQHGKLLPYEYGCPRTCYISVAGRFANFIYSITLAETQAQLLRQENETSPRIVYTCNSRTTIMSGGLKAQLSGPQCDKMIQDSGGQLDKNFLIFEVDLTERLLIAKVPDGIDHYEDTGCPI